MRSVGVEEELLLLDDSGQPRALSSAVLHSARRDCAATAEVFEAELQRQQVGATECVGRIEALGPDTEGLTIGERVVNVAIPAVPGPPVASTWQEYLVADTRRLLPVPDHSSDSDACQPDGRGLHRRPGRH